MTVTAQQLCFVDGTFAEQAQEMADYLQVGDQVRPLVEKDQREEVLQVIVKASAALNSAPEKEFTPSYNFLVHLVLDSAEPKKYLPTMCQNLLKPITSSPANGFALASNALGAIFNQLAPNNPLRFNVFMQIIRFVRQQNQFDNLKPNLKHLDAWFKEWETPEEDQHKLYVEVAEAAAEAGDRKDSYYFLLKALGSIDPDNQEQLASEESQKLSVRALRMAISSPTRYDFNGLRAYPAVQALADSQPVYSQLLDIFTEQDLEDYNEFRAEHEGWIEKEKLDHELLQHKMRLLTFASLAASTPNRMIPYDKVAHALQVPVEDMEMWTIDAIRAGLVEGRLSQKKRVFLVHRTTYRVFGEKQWRELGTRIDQLRGVIDHVSANLRKGQMDAEQTREREQQEMEKKLSGVGLGDGGGRSGGDYNRRRGGQQQRQRADDDE